MNANRALWRNPLANADQFAAERDVVAMWQTEAVKRARATCAVLFGIAYGRDTPDECRPDFDAAMDEYVTNYLFKAAASDGAHPRFVRNFMPAYHWDGRDVPGARMGGDNPDNCYRLAGVAHGGTYRVTVRPTGVEPANSSFTLVGNFGTSVTIQTIESHEMVRASDGSFTITIDDQPADGRPNHLTTAPHVKFLFVRESFEDWNRERSCDFTIKRLDPVDTPPLTIEQMAERAAFRAVEDVPLYFWFQRMFSGLPLNSFRPPMISGGVGGLVTQAGLQGWYRLEADDDAVMIRYHAAGAAYVSIETGDWWFRSIDAHLRQSSLTSRQSVPDADGWITAVASRRDPGIANWIDVGDEKTFLLFLRWQGLPAGHPQGPPQIEATLTNIGDLPARLLRDQPMAPAARANQLAARIAAWDSRITPESPD